MNIRNCSNCNKIYQYDGFNLCHECRQENERDFMKVKEYLREKPGANISEVSEETEVPSKKIMEFLREGRLEIEPGGDIVLECEKCKKAITSGRYCNSCQSQLYRELGQVVDSAKSEEAADVRVKDERFRVADRYRRK